MSTGFGIDPTIDPDTGNIVSGTDSRDIRRVTSALYTPGVISGGIVTTNPDMTYSISEGVACVKMAQGENVLIPIPQTTLATDPGGTSSRTDYIYAKQNDPATDGTSSVDVYVSTSSTIPAGSVQLDKYRIPAGASSTNAGNRAGKVDYSIPYGTSGHSLWWHTIKHNGPMTEIADQVSGTFYLPTDRAVEFSALSTLDVVGQAASLYFRLSIDGIQKIILPTGPLTTWYTSHFLAYTFALGPGEHTVSVKFTASGDMADINCRYSEGNNAGIVMKLRDDGIMT